MKRLKELQQIAQEIISAHPKIKPDQAFSVWYLQRLGIPMEKAVASLTGLKDEQGMDAICIDDSRRQVIVVQTKLHTESLDSQENEDHLIRFYANIPQFDRTSDELKFFKKALNDQALSLFNEALKKRRYDDYRLWFIFLTTRDVSPEKEQRVRASAPQFPRPTDSLDFAPGKEVDSLIEDFLINHASPPPQVHFELSDKSYLIFDDPATNLRARVVTVPANQVKRAFDEWNERLFNLNIRGYEGSAADVNQQIKDTLENKPELFWYLNNGITIVCDSLSVSGDEKPALKLVKPQIINGQQTTRTIALSDHGGGSARVLVKIIEVPAKHALNRDQVIRRIVQATNSQNRIQLADLASNEANQIEIEALLLEQGYLYQRKRKIKPTPPPGSDPTAFEGRNISLHAIWKPIAVTQFGPLMTKHDDEVFDLEVEPGRTDYYNAIFNPEKGAWFILLHHWLDEVVSEYAPTQELNRAQRYVLKLFWDLGAKTLAKSSHFADALLAFHDWDSDRTDGATQVEESFRKPIENLYNAVLGYYNAHPKKNMKGKLVEIATYLNQAELYGKKLLPAIKKKYADSVASAVEGFLIKVKK